MSNLNTDYKLIPLRHGFVSVNPEPEGIVHFIGGYFFGTWVNFFYDRLLDELKRRFTVHAYSYSFAELSHWKIASDLLEEIECVKQTVSEKAKQLGYPSDIYTDPRKECLVGHSLGTECIALIRFLGLKKDRQLQLLQKARQELGRKVVTDRDFSDVENLPQQQPIPYKASLLMAPCFKTPSSIGWLLAVRPKQQLMRYLIQQESSLLPLTSLISFKCDRIAKSDVEWVHQELSKQGSLIDFREIDNHHPLWTSLCDHMTPAFDPINSGLADCAAEFIGQLMSCDPSVEKELMSVG